VYRKVHIRRLIDERRWAMDIVYLLVVLVFFALTWGVAELVGKL
jgi:hypothetical protein